MFLSTHPIHTSYQYTLFISIHPSNPSYQQTRSTHPINKHTLSTHCISGDAGYTSLLRVFQSFDDDGDKTLSLGELKKALKALDIVAKENEVRLLFEYFDNDNSETIR